jgi:hypothetical protein
MSKEKKEGIGLPEVKYIASVGKCPNCGSTSVRFRLPLESYIETKDLKLNKVVLDFSNPQYWLKTTTTHCAVCGYEFHLRDHVDDFYKGLQEVREQEGDMPNKWYYQFEEYKTEE